MVELILAVGATQQKLSRMPYNIGRLQLPGGVFVEVLHPAFTELG